MRNLVLFLFFVPLAAFADFELRFSDGSVAAVGDGHVRFGDDKEYTLARAGENSVILVSVEKRTWTRMNPGEMQAQMQLMMEQLLAAMPPEQRAMAEQELKQGLPRNAPKATVKRTGNTRSVSGYDCSEVEVRDADGSLDEIVCVATPDELGIDKKDFKAFAAGMRRVFDVMGMGSEAVPEADLALLGGMPISSRESGDSDDSELVSIETGSVPGSLFVIPAGYREVSLQDMMRE